jgi:hypothetical protein
MKCAVLTGGLNSIDHMAALVVFVFPVRVAATPLPSDSPSVGAASHQVGTTSSRCSKAHAMNCTPAKRTVSEVPVLYAKEYLECYARGVRPAQCHVQASAALVAKHPGQVVSSASGAAMYFFRCVLYVFGAVV